MPKNKNENLAVDKESVSNSFENKDKNQSDKKFELSLNREKVAFFLNTAGILTIICAAAALMLGFINYMTEDIIARREEESQKAAVYEIFTDADEVLTPEGDDSLFLVVKNGEFQGYCVSTVTSGYGGDINLIVGVSPDKTVKGVKVVSMNETAGLGSKTRNTAFLDQFIGKSTPLTVGENVDAVSGATVSSKAVTEGIKKALNYPVEYIYAVNTEENTSDENTDVDSDKQSEESLADNSVNETNNNLNSVEESHIDPDHVGALQNYRYYSDDKSYTATKDTVGSYLEKETTDTESDTE